MPSYPPAQLATHAACAPSDRVVRGISPRTLAAAIQDVGNLTRVADNEDHHLVCTTDLNLRLHEGHEAMLLHGIAPWRSYLCPRDGRSVDVEALFSGQEIEPSRRKNDSAVCHSEASDKLSSTFQTIRKSLELLGLAILQNRTGNPHIHEETVTWRHRYGRCRCSGTIEDSLLPTDESDHSPYQYDQEDNRKTNRRNVPNDMFPDFSPNHLVVNPVTAGPRLGSGSALLRRQTRGRCAMAPL